jgi:hypothetical protein
VKSKNNIKEDVDINTVADIPESWVFVSDKATVGDIQSKYAQVKKTIECDSFYVETAKKVYLNVYGMIGVVPDINKLVYPIVINGVEYMSEEKENKMKKTFAESYIVEESNFVKELKEEDVLEPVERNMINEKIVNKVDEYRLTWRPISGYHWQDKRDGSDNVYKRDFPTKLELEQFITEYFGKRFLNTVKFPEEIKEDTDILKTKTAQEGNLKVDMYKMNSGKTAIRMTDIDSGEVLNIKVYPTHESAEKGFNTEKMYQECIEEATTEWDPDYWMKELVKEVGKDKAIEAIKKSKSHQDVKNKQLEKINKITPENLKEDIEETDIEEAEKLKLVDRDFGEGVPDIGQFTPEQLKFLNKMVKKGVMKIERKGWQGTNQEKKYYKFADTTTSNQNISEAVLEKSKYDALVNIVESLSKTELESTMEILGSIIAKNAEIDVMKLSGIFERSFNDIRSALNKHGNR